MTRQEGTEEEGEEMARLRLDRTQNTDRDTLSVISIKMVIYIMILNKMAKSQHKQRKKKGAQD